MHIKGKIITIIMFAGAIFFLLWLFNHTSIQRLETNESVKKEIGQPFVYWQKIRTTIMETGQEMVININIPKVIISNHNDLGSKFNEAVERYIEALKDGFISGVNTAAYDNIEASTLNIDTEVLLITPRLISLAFTSTEHLAGFRDNAPERTFFIFDFVKGERFIEGNELFRDDLAWSDAVKAIKVLLLSNYQGDPSCDLSFAPKQSGFTVSCIGVDRSQGGRHLSISGDIPIAMIQEFLAPSVLADITR